jgi:hypothetical protein
LKEQQRNYAAEMRAASGKPVQKKSRANADPALRNRTKTEQKLPNNYLCLRIILQ